MIYVYSNVQNVKINNSNHLQSVQYVPIPWNTINIIPTSRLYSKDTKETAQRG